MAGDDPRTLKQNDTYHQWRKEISAEAIAHGIDATQVYKNPQDIPLTPEIVHARIHDILKQQFGIDSTAKATRNQLSQAVNIFADWVNKISKGNVNVRMRSREMTPEDAERMFQDF